MPGNRPWALVAPWYRWKEPLKAASGRQSRPIFQKYETANLVNEFLKDPQHSLRFTAEDKIVVPLTLSTVTKIYLDTHKRFYLVAAELHCDAAGFPDCCRKQVCEAGFVVRRRVPRIPAESVGEAELVMRRLGGVRSRYQAAEQASPGGSGTLARLLAYGTDVDRFRVAAQEEYLQQFERLDSLGVQLAVEGWIPSDYDRVGSWQPVEDTPQQVTETIYPLYPLVPDPGIADHSGRGHSIFFGLLPTSSADVTDQGQARFDAETLYEARCFVRRHKPCCPMTGKRNDCPGELAWSRSTEVYRLAPQTDLTGTSNRPVTIQMPDLEKLKAEVKALPPGAGAPVRVVSPPKSNLEFKVDVPNLKLAQTNPPSGAICSFSIPLITIVAMFVFKLFLPIVVFAFNLYYLLALRFCIPPSFSLDAGVVLDLNKALDAGLEIDTAVEKKIDDAFVSNFGLDAAGKAALQAGCTVEERGRLAARLSTDFGASMGLPATGSAVAGEVPSVIAPERLQYETRVEVPVQ
jgi:hypothetical protein